MDGNGFTEVIVINGMDCDYDPERNLARIYCDSCSALNEVEVFVEDGEVIFQGFVCEKCGAWNSPQE